MGYVNEPQITKRNYSKIGKLSFAVCLLGFLAYFLSYVIIGNMSIPKEKEPYFMIVPLISWAISFTLGITDIRRKNRKKLLSIISIVLCGIPLFFIVAVYFFILFVQWGM